MIQLKIERKIDFMKENMVYTTGMIDENGSITVPGVYLESGTVVELAIKTVPGKFEIALFPTDMEDDGGDFDDEDCDEDEDDICDGDCVHCPFAGKDGLES